MIPNMVMMTPDTLAQRLVFVPNQPQILPKVDGNNRNNVHSITIAQPMTVITSFGHGVQVLCIVTTINPTNRKTPING